MMMISHPLLLLAVLLLLRVSFAREGASNTIPRSTHHRLLTESDSLPWNPSSQIDDEGFLTQEYFRCPGEWEAEYSIGGMHDVKRAALDEIAVKIRQVPGDGNCLFHSLSVCLAKVENGSHFCFDNLKQLQITSTSLRERAVDFLSSNPRRMLFLQGKEFLRAKDLVEAAASQYSVSGKEYCDTMRQNSYWGGGPEIVALCNLLQRPIHVYELTSQDRQFWLRRMACFGSPKFDRREALHILSADSRFPDVQPGKHLEIGNHFLAIFPLSIPRMKRRAIRGGGLREVRIEPAEQSIEEALAVDKRGLVPFISFWWNMLLSGFLGRN
jgi:hypothetical protein